MQTDDTIITEVTMHHTVLFIDDEQGILDSITRALHRENFIVKTESDPRRALAMLSEIRPCVVITDMRMPDLDGIGFLTEAQKILPDAVYLVLSGYADIDHIMKAVNEQHVWRYITKPWQKEELRLTIRNAIEMFDYREARRSLLMTLEEKNRQLTDLANILEEKVRERSRQLEQKNEILQLLAEDAALDTILPKVCSAISMQLDISSVYIDVPFAARCFANTETEVPPDLREQGKTAILRKKEFIDASTLAIPLMHNESVLGVVLAQTGTTFSGFSLTDTTGSFFPAAVLSLMHAKNMLEINDLPEKIDRLIGGNT